MHYTNLFTTLTTLTLALPLLAETTISKYGCYSHVPALKKSETYPFQSLTYCETKCQKDGFRIAAVSEGSTCACSHELPKEADRVDDDQCDAMCDGWPGDQCGGAKAYTVLSTGEYTTISNSDLNYDPKLYSNLNSNSDSNSKSEHNDNSNSNSNSNDNDEDNEEKYDDSSSDPKQPTGIIVAPTNINPSSVPTGILTAPASMMSKASPTMSKYGSAAPVTSTVTSTMASPTLNAAESLSFRTGFSIGGLMVAGLGLLL